MAEDNESLSAVAKLIADLAVKIEEDRKETDERIRQSEERTVAWMRSMRRDRESRNSERFSFSVAHDRESDEEESEHPDLREYLRATVLHKQEKVDPAMVISVLSFPALKVALENQSQHEATHSQFRNLGHFLSKDIRKALVENEIRHHRNTSMTVSTILKQNDKALVLMFASLIRTKEMGTKDGFAKTIGLSIPRLKASGRDSDRDMVTRDYDKFFHAQVTKQIETAEKVLELAYTGATVWETRFWPKPIYGKEKDYGLLKIILKTCGKYEENFQNYITMEKLKNFTSTDELFSTMRSINDKMSAKAERLRADDAQIGKSTPLNEIFSEIDDLRKNPNAILTRDGPRHANLPMTPFTAPSNSGTSRFQPRTFGGDRRQGQSNDSNRNRSYEQFGRNSRIRIEIPEGESLDDSLFDCVNPLLSPPPEQRNQQFAQDDQFEFDSCWGPFEENDNVAELNAAWQPGKPTIAGPPNKTLYDPKAKKTDPTKPCFRHFEGECPGNCGWDHSHDAMVRLANERLTSVLKSRFIPYERLKAEVAKLENQSRTGARVASFVTPDDLGEWKDSDYKSADSGPSLSRVVTSSQPIQNNTPSAGQELSC